MQPIRSLFLASCDVVLEAVSDPRVGAAWDAPSVLEQQTVGSLVGHFGRGSWATLQYLDEPVPAGPVAYESAADYFATIMDNSTPELHAGIRDRGAEEAAAGPDAIAKELAAKIIELRERLATEPDDRLVPVFGGVMGLDEYLGTRVLEQVVHLDDLARSIDIEPWENAPGAMELVLSCGAEIGQRRFGGTRMLRALFRSTPGEASPFPVLQDPQ